MSPKARKLSSSDPPAGGVLNLISSLHPTESLHQILHSLNKSCMHVLDQPSLQHITIGI